MSHINNKSLYETIPPFENNSQIKFIEHKCMYSLFSHWHPHIELNYITQGSCSFILNGKTYSLSEGDLVIATANSVHSFTSECGIRFFCILISPEFLSDIDLSKVHIKNIVSSDSYIKESFSRLNEESSTDTISSYIMKKSIIYGLLAYLVRNYSEKNVTKQSIDSYSAVISRIRTVENYVSQNYKTKISTQDLAKLFYISENHFCRFFKKYIGKSSVDYINEYRINKALPMLRNTDMPITEIAYSVGFENANYFARIFKKIKKVSPSDYRSGKIVSEREY